MASRTSFGRLHHVGLYFTVFGFWIVFPLSVSILYSIIIPVGAFFGFLVTVAHDAVFPRDNIIPIKSIKDKRYLFIEIED